MGIFYSKPKSAAPVSGGHESTHHAGSAANDHDFGDRNRRISPYELKKQVRHDLHDKLGRSKGSAVYNTLMAHADKDSGFGTTTGVSGREIDDMLDTLKENHTDNLHERDLDHIRDVLGKHFND